MSPGGGTAGERKGGVVKRVLLVLAAAAAAGGCRTEQLGPNNAVQKPQFPEGSRNEQEAEDTVRKALRCYVDWDLEGAYKLICRSDRAKMSWADFKAGSEKKRESLVKLAREAQIVNSGESTLSDGTPYVTVIVRVGPNEVVPYSVVREQEGWRLILVDDRRARQSKE
jgi:hypothetical protein